MERAYDPLSLDQLGRNAVRALMEYPSDTLPPSEPFDGPGIYTIHYQGEFPAYSDLAEDEPIYVGKAEPSGRRQGRRARSGQRDRLYRRLAHHADSIGLAHDLELHDFSCRWLILEPVWIGLTEQVLIEQYQPLWNVVVDGFGNNDPGRGRWNQRRSDWDTLHPGREWASNLQDSNKNREDILKEIAKHRRMRRLGQS